MHRIQAPVTYIQSSYKGQNSNLYKHNVTQQKHIILTALVYNYFFNVNYKSFNKIYRVVAEIQKFKNLNLKTSVSNVWTAHCLLNTEFERRCCFVSKHARFHLIIDVAAQFRPAAQGVWLKERGTNIWVYMHGWLDLESIHLVRLPGTSFCVNIQ